MYKQLASLMVICFISISYTVAQEVPRIIQFKRTDYNAGHQNWMCTEDCDGFLYVANTEGVLIFNGFKWQQVQLPQLQKPRAVFTGRDCKVYVGTYEAFGYIDVSDRNKPRYIPVADSLLAGSNEEIWNIMGDDEAVFFQSFSRIYKYDYAQISTILPPGNIMLGKKIGEQLYVPKIEQGLYEIVQNKVVEVSVANQLPPQTKIADMCASGRPGEIVIGTQYYGVFLIRDNELEVIKSELNEQLKNEQINKIIRLSSGDFAIGTILNGVYITTDFVRIKYHINKSNGLSNNTVLSFYEDKNKELWVGLDKGLDLIKTYSPVNYVYDRQGVLGTVFTSIHYEGVLYLGTNQGVFKANSDGSFTLLDDSQGQIWSFLIVDGDLLCGHNNGAYLIKNNSFTKISEVTGGWSMKAIDQRRVLQSTYTGLAILEKQAGVWGKVTRVTGGDVLLERFILSGNTLLGYGAFDGVSLVRFSDDYEEVIQKKDFIKIDHYDSNEDPFFLSLGNQLMCLMDTTLFILDQDSFRRVQPREFEALKGEKEFARQYQYISVIKALSKTEHLSNYHFANPEYDEPNFMIGFDEGYVIVPRSYELDEGIPESTDIDYILINGQIHKGDYEDLILEPGQDDIVIQLKDVSFKGHAHSFQYKLSHWDEQWYDIPPDGQLSFINLDDGRYKLNITDDKHSPFTLLQFSIKPYWYESWIGGLCYLALLGFLIWLLNKRNQKNLFRKTERLEKEKQRELESERMKAKNDKLEREIIYKSKMLANSTMALVQKNKMLGELKAVIAKDDLTKTNTVQYKRRLLNLIDRNIDSDEDWEIFERNFAEVHEDFLEKLKTNYPDITAGELKLAAYIRMNLSSKEIAPLLNISVRSVENKRYRLRKKMGIDHDDNLSDHLLRL